MVLLDVRIVPMVGRFFVDVRCNRCREVWSESNHETLEEARNRRAKIFDDLPTKEMVFLHFATEMKVPELGSVEHAKGDLVKWSTLSGPRIGYFQEWDNGTACIMQVDDSFTAVRGR